MTLQFFIHLKSKRAEAVALIDSGPVKTSTEPDQVLRSWTDTLTISACPRKLHFLR